MATDDQPRGAGDRRSHLATGPHLPDPRQHLVEHLAPPARLDPAELVVVVAPAQPDAEGEAAARERLHAQRLLRQLDRVLAQRPSRTVVESPIRSVTAAAPASAVNGS